MVNHTLCNRNSTQSEGGSEFAYVLSYFRHWLSPAEVQLCQSKKSRCGLKTLPPPGPIGRGEGACNANISLHLHWLFSVIQVS